MLTNLPGNATPDSRRALRKMITAGALLAVFLLAAPTASQAQQLRLINFLNLGRTEEVVAARLAQVTVHLYIAAMQFSSLVVRRVLSQPTLTENGQTVN